MLRSIASQMPAPNDKGHFPAPVLAICDNRCGMTTIEADLRSLLADRGIPNQPQETVSSSAFEADMDAAKCGLKIGGSEPPVDKLANAIFSSVNV